MADHKVVTRKEAIYPFQPYWTCVCGHKLVSRVMGLPLQKEFAQHLEEEERAKSNSETQVGGVARSASPAQHEG